MGTQGCGDEELSHRGETAITLNNKGVLKEGQFLDKFGS